MAVGRQRSSAQAGELVGGAALVISIAALAAGASGCRALSDAFVCAHDAQCVTSAGAGRCEPDGHCSLPDQHCPDGRRYVAAAGERSGRCVGAALTDGSPGSPRWVWSSDLEQGTLDDWWSPGPAGKEGGNGGGEYNDGNADSAVTTERAHGGLRAVRQQLETTAAASSTRLFRWDEGRRYPGGAYYSAWFFVEQRFRYLDTSSWWELMLFTSSRAGSGRETVIALMLDYTYDAAEMFLQLRLYRTDGGGGWDDFDQRLLPIPVGRWFHLEAFLQQSAAAAGRLTVWQDGVEIFDREGLTTRYAEQGGENAWAIANGGAGLAGSQITTFVDDAVISLDRNGP